GFLYPTAGGDKSVPGVDADDDIVVKPFAGGFDQGGIFHGQRAEYYALDAQGEHFLNRFDIAHTAAQLGGNQHHAGDVADNIQIFGLAAGGAVQVNDMETGSAQGLPF